MQALLGFELNFWDYITFASLFILGAAFITALVLIAGLPGRIAIARKHPDARGCGSRSTWSSQAARRRAQR